MKYRFIEDPGHGWLEVPFHEVQELEIEKKISGCSYVGLLNGRLMIYLEEDCDASEFFKAYKEKHGVPPEHITIYQENTPIRKMKHYHNPDYKWEGGV